MRHEFAVEGPLEVRARTRSSDLSLLTTSSASPPVPPVGPDTVTTEVLSTIDEPVGMSAVVDLRGSPELVNDTLVELSGSVLTIEVPRSRSFLRSGSLTIAVEVPPSSTAEIIAGSGDVRTGGGLAQVAVRTGSGDVTLGYAEQVEVAAGSGDVRLAGAASMIATTGSGDLMIESVTASGQVRAGSGDIRIGAASGLSVASGSGDIVVGTANGVLGCRTGSGDVLVRAIDDGRLTAKSGSGDLVIGITAGSAALLDCRSVSGRVTSELDSGDAPSEGEGAVAIEARTASGSIRIVRA